MKDVRKALITVCAEKLEEMATQQVLIYSGLLMAGDVLYVLQGWLVVEQNVSLLAVGISTGLVTRFSDDLAVVAKLSESLKNIEAGFCVNQTAAIHTHDIKHTITASCAGCRLHQRHAQRRCHGAEADARGRTSCCYCITHKCFKWRCCSKCFEWRPCTRATHAAVRTTRRRRVRAHL